LSGPGEGGGGKRGLLNEYQRGGVLGYLFPQKENPKKRPVEKNPTQNKPTIKKQGLGGLTTLVFVNCSGKKANRSREGPTL